MISADVALLVILLVGATSIIIAMSAGSSKSSAFDFVLGEQKIPSDKVSQLILSTSFSMNGIFYQMRLGYLIGLWALLIQLAWAASFFILAKKIQDYR